MNADFHYRDKIAVAVVGQETEMGRQLVKELAGHPWFVLAQGDDPIGLTIMCRGHSEVTPRIVAGGDFVVIPEVNSHQISDASPVVGFPSAATAALAIALKPLQAVYGIAAMRSVVLSGPGFGPNNVCPDADLGQRVESELRQVLGLSSAVPCTIDAVGVPVSQQVVQCVSVRLARETSYETLKSEWQRFINPLASLQLPSLRQSRVNYWDEPQGPPSTLMQSPSLDVHISRLQECPIFGYKFVVSSTAHRMGAIVLAELMVKMGKVFW